MSGTRRNFEGEKTSYKTNENSFLNESSAVGRIGRKLFLSFLATLALTVPVEVGAEQNPVEVSCIDVDGGVRHDLDGRLLFVSNETLGRTVSGVSDMLGSDNAHCLQSYGDGGLKTHCFDDNGEFSTPDDGYITLERFSVTPNVTIFISGGVVAGSLALDMDGDLNTYDDWVGFERTNVEGYGFPVGSSIKLLPQSEAAIAVKYSFGEGADPVNGVLKHFFISIDETGFNYNHTVVLGGEIDNFGMDLTDIVGVWPSIVGDKIFSVFKEEMGTDKVINVRKVSGFVPDARQISIIENDSYLIEGIDNISEVFHDDGESFYFFGDGQMYAYNYNYVPPLDTDNDGVPDETDNCIDDDGVGDVCDNCPDDANTDQNPDVCAIVVVEDRDNDDIPDDSDNCINSANSDQADLDEDGLGDVCDDDIDGDGVLNDQDQCPRTHDGSIGIGAGSESDGCPIDDQDTGTGDAGNDIIEDTNTTPDTNIDADTGTTTPDINIEEDTGSVEPDVPEADTDSQTNTPDVTVPGNGLGEPSSAEPAPSCSTVPAGIPVKKGPWGVLVVAFGTGLAWFRRKK